MRLVADAGPLRTADPPAGAAAANSVPRVRDVPRPRSWRSLSSLVLCLWAIAGPRATGKDLDRTEFLRNSRDAIAALEAAFGSCEISGIETITGDAGQANQLVRRYQRRILIHPPGARLETTWLPDDVKSHSYYQTIEATDGSTGFELKRGRPDAELFVAYSGDDLRHRRSLENACRILAQAPVRLLFVNVREILDGPDYVVDRVSTSSEGSTESIRIDFRARPGAACRPGPSAPRPESGPLVIDPARQHALVRFEYLECGSGSQSGTDRRTVSGHIEYSSGIGDAPVPRRYTYEFRNNDYLGRFEFEYEKVIPNALPSPEHFRLAHFGFGKLEGPEGRGLLGSPTFWLFGLAIAAAFVAVWLRRRA
jgi:hypothetical protein